MNDVFFALARASITGTLLCAVYLLLRRFLPKALGLAWREMLCALLVIHLLIPIEIPSPASVYAIAPAEIWQPTQPEIQTPPAPVDFYDVNVEPYEIAETAFKPDYEQILQAIWLAGTAAMLTLSALRSRRIRRFIGKEYITDAFTTDILREAEKAAGLKRLPALRLCGCGPAVKGILKPEILLPQTATGLTFDTLYMILLHECVHIRRGDVFKLRLLALVDAVYWWNPAIRAATKFARRDIELLCDNRVMREMPFKQQRIAYGRAIINAAAAERPSPLPAAAGMDVKERIRMIKAFRKPKVWITLISALMCIAIAAAFLTLPPVAEAAPSIIIPEAVVIIPANTPSPTPTALSEATPEPSAVAEPTPMTMPTPTPTPKNLPKHGDLVEWSDVNELWADGESVTVVDYKTRKSFVVMRVNGYTEGNFHADFETESTDDTKAFKKIYGGEWSWDRRPVLAYIDGTWVAASVSGMPHGEEFIDDNGVSGFFCMHFSGSLAHNTGKADSEHQRAVLRAAGK